MTYKKTGAKCGNPGAFRPEQKAYLESQYDEYVKAKNSRKKNTALSVFWRNTESEFFRRWPLTAPTDNGNSDSSEITPPVPAVTSTDDAEDSAEDLPDSAAREARRS